jgi:hypothetical protein
VGAVLGLAIYNSIILDVHFATATYKVIMFTFSGLVFLGLILNLTNWVGWGGELQSHAS